MNLMQRIINAFKPTEPPPSLNEDDLARSLSRASRAREDFDKQMAEFEERMADLRREANWLYVHKS